MYISDKSKKVIEAILRNHTLNEVAKTLDDRVIKDLSDLNIDILLYKKLKEKFLTKELSENINTKLNNEFLKEIASSSLLLEEFKILNSKIKHQNCIIIKSFSLLGAISNGFYKRTYDIDLLSFDRKSRSNISKILKKNGYKKPLLYFAHGESMFVKNDFFHIDLHCELHVSRKLSSLIKLPNERLLKNIEEREINGIKYHRLSLEYSLIHAYIHYFINHNFSDPLLLYEIIELHEKLNKRSSTYIFESIKNTNLTYIAHSVIKESLKYRENEFANNILTLIQPNNRHKKIYDELKKSDDILHKKNSVNTLIKNLEITRLELMKIKVMELSFYLEATFDHVKNLFNR